MTFGDGLWEAFGRMMSFREATGYATATYRSPVPPFIDYCARSYADSPVITQQMVDGRLAGYPYSSTSRAVSVSLLREYTKYLRFLGRDGFIPDGDYSTKRNAFNPYPFTDDGLHRLFAAFDGCSGATCGKRHLPEVVLPVSSRLGCCFAAGCGFRGILCRDVTLSKGDIYIRQSKRHKDRHITSSDDMLELCRRYDMLAGKRHRFFQKWDGGSYPTSRYNQVWRSLWKKVALRVVAPPGHMV